VAHAENARSALIDAAMDLFGGRGYDMVTTRELAEHAGVNLGLIAYYFGDKSGLQQAMLAQVMAEIGELIEPIAGAVRKALPACKGDPNAVAGVARTFFDAWCRSVLGDVRLQKRIPCVVRELAPPRRNLEIVYVGMIEPLEDVLAQLVAAFHRWDPGDPATRVRAHAVFNILFGLTANDVILWRRMGWKRYTKNTVEATIAMTIDTFLAALAA
jgi:AcrR family transcriptional regulator